MPKFYTVATNNAFAALDEQDDGDDLILNQSPTQLSQMAAEKEAAAAAAVSAPFKDAKNAADQKKRGPRPARPAENRVRRTPSGEAQDPNEEDGVKAPRVPRERKLRPEGRLERRSGTGYGREVKKDGAGAHSWGQAGDEGAADQVPAEGAVPAEKEGAPEGAAADAKPENVVQTFADYKAEQDKSRGDGLEVKQPSKSDTSAALSAGVRVYTKIAGEAVAIKSAQTAGERAKGGSSSPVVNFRYNAPRPPREDNRRSERASEGPADSKTNGDRASSKGSNSDLKLDDAQAFPTLAH